MAADKNKTDNTPESISVESLQAENEALKNRIIDLEVKEKAATETLAEKTTLLNENEALKLKLAELTTVTGDSELNRIENEKGDVKIKILAPVAGKFFLPYNVGQVVYHPAQQADEMVEARYAEYVK